jgi:HAD superfamily hydrolase (TIGR01509 family)
MALAAPDLFVIFDVDGVILDSEPQSLKALYVAADRISAGQVRFSPNELALLSGRDDDYVARYINEKFNLSLDPAAFRSLKLDCYRKVIEETPIAPAPGILELLADLDRAQVPYAVATSATRAKLDISFQALGLNGRFGLIITADDVAAAKPAPDVFLRAAERLRADPRKTVVFEDTMNGVLAANGAGMISVAITGTFAREAFCDARHVVDSLAQVNVAMLRQWVLDTDTLEKG